MDEGPRVLPYDCPQCGAGGELPAVEGETFCPQCGGHLWTVRPVPRREKASGLAPDYRLPVQDGRPPLPLKGLRLARICFLLFHPIVCLWLTLRQRAMERRVLAKLDQMALCRERAELEAVLGKPRYAVSATHLPERQAEDTRDAADLIECYESQGCCIDLWFKGDRLVHVSGFVKPTIWDVAVTGGLQQDVR